MRSNGRKEAFLGSTSLDLVGVWSWLFDFEVISSVSSREAMSVSLCNNKGSCDWGFGTGLSDSSQVNSEIDRNNINRINRLYYTRCCKRH